MQFSGTFSIDVERVEGKFASRDEIEEAIQTAFQDAVGNVNLSGLGADGTSEYEVTDATFDIDPKGAKR